MDLWKLVGRVGIEPTTNGLRVQGTPSIARYKPKKCNGSPAPQRPCGDTAGLFHLRRQHVKAVPVLGSGVFGMRDLGAIRGVKDVAH